MTNPYSQVIAILKDQVRPALGCTDPGAIALATATARKYSPGNIKQVDVSLSISLFKNAFAVKIPGPGEAGIELAAALGVVAGDTGAGLEVLRKITLDDIEEARSLLARGLVNIATDVSCSDLYLQAVITTETGIAEVTIEEDYANITLIRVNGEIVYQGNKKPKKYTFDGLSFERIREIVSTIPLDEVGFIIDGLQMNRRLVQIGLQEGYGMGLARGLQALVDKGYLANDLACQVKVSTAAAIDARMGGAQYPAMSTGGSGNQGICASIPIGVVAKYFQVPPEILHRALVYSNLVTIYNKEFMGRLGGACGAAICSGIGVAVATAWMLGGNAGQIAAAIKNMAGNLSGIICDGGKPGCSMKVSTCASEAVVAALLSLQGIEIETTNGIVGDTVLETLENIASVCNQGMAATNRSIYAIMKRKAECHR